MRVSVLDLDGRFARSFRLPVPSERSGATRSESTGGPPRPPSFSGERCPPEALDRLPVVL